VPGGFSALYNTTKAAVVALAESLAIDLAEVGAPIGVSLLCPGFVRSNILESPKHRPSRFPESRAVDRLAAQVDLEARFRAGLENGTDPAEIAAAVLAAVRGDQFWVLPHPQYDDRIRDRVVRALERGGPPSAR
jgi:NAD(P)-dependent dehydrogenase (short-subunit alcohol dehydrogenase family)